MKHWKIINQQYNANLFPYAYHVKAMGAEFAKTCGRKAASDNFVELRNDGELTQGWHWEEYHQAGKYILERLEEPTYAKQVLKNTNIYLKSFFIFAESIINSNLKVKLNSQLNQTIIKFRDLFTRLASWGVLISIVEYEHELLSKKIKSFLREKIKNYKLEITVEELFQVLTTSSHSTYLVKERDDLLQIAKKIWQKPRWRHLFHSDFNKIVSSLERFPQLARLVKLHYEKYKWLSFGFEGPLLHLEDITRSLVELIKKQPFELEKQISKNGRHFLLAQKKWLKKLRATDQERHLLWIAREIGFSKAFRKDIEYHGNYAYHLLLAEIGKRFYFTPHQGYYLSVEELSEILLGKKEVDFNIIQERIKHSVYACEHLKIRLVHGKKAEVYRRNFEKQKIQNNINQLNGQCACPGRARGTVKVVLDQKEYGKFYAHNVLVTVATNPNMVPLMKIAKAIITDVGGITCHAAIVSRELNIPCVIGTKIATQVLRDGDLVEVDAGKGTIEIIR